MGHWYGLCFTVWYMVESEQATVCLTPYRMSMVLQTHHSLERVPACWFARHFFLFSFFFLFFLCCPIIRANFRGIAHLVLIMASLPPATPKTHSTSVALPPEVHKRCQIITGMWGTLFELKILPRCCRLQNSSTKTKPLHWHGFLYVLLPFTAKLNYFSRKVASFLQH